MKNVKCLVLGITMLCSGPVGNVKAGLPASAESTKQNKKHYVQHLRDAIYDSLDFGNDKPLSKEVFTKAYIGYLNLKAEKKLDQSRDILSIADYSISANEKRLWVIDLTKKEVLFHSLVAHGQGTGDEFARNFSNKVNSHQTSLGFFITDGTYMGSNGYSLRLHGVDDNYNDKALARAIVIHGADYVSDDFIRNHKRLGRSWGCPALPPSLTRPIIDSIQGQTCFFAYYPDDKYLASSKWLKNMPRLSDEQFIETQFNITQKSLLATADLLGATGDKEIKDKKRESVYGGVILNLPDTMDNNNRL